MHTGSIVAIYVGPESEGPMKQLDAVRAVAGRGLEGDRYFGGAGTFSDKASPGRQVTFIEREAVEAVNRDAGIVFDASESRRNIVTSDVALNHLVGREFRVGDARFRGVKLCEPCKHLEGLTGKEIRLPLLHRGGLNAEILTDGLVRVGDALEVL